MIYTWIGRAVVRFVRARYRRQIRVVLAVALASLLLGGYLAASRNFDEG